VSVLIILGSAIAETFVADRTAIALRIRSAVDRLSTLGVTALAFGLAVGYLTLPIWGRRLGNAG
jgi:hypothetical protein